MMRCPTCGSDRIQYVSTYRRDAPSITQGICGYLLLGPIGLLCSFCGNSERKEEFWICKDCGRKFR